ncbi:MAG TPA: A24 family peptidase [Fimbriiglobus sp.]|nr:A24 family peptidase [Fimbriiglobus sp.]
MANDLTAVSAPPVGAVVPTKPDDLGLDRDFLMSMARVPLIAVLWVAAAWAASAAVETFGWHVQGINIGPLAVIGFGMLLAAFIDGYAFKVPNWCTLSLVVSGWYVGLLHDFGVHAIPGQGGLAAALAGTALGFALLFPALFIGGMGQGDVKMTMGFGSWVAAYFGIGAGATVLFWSFAIGVLVGGVFGLVMMALRRQFYKNASNFREIVRDLQVMVTAGPGKAAERANSRRKDWWRLPYGVPLCVGFIGYLAFDLYRFVATGQ